MFNVGGPEVLVILLLALIVLGPQRLPEAARQLGRARAELRKLSTGFQQELRTAFDEETDAAAKAAAPDQGSTNGKARPRKRTEPLRADRQSAERPAP